MNGFLSFTINYLSYRPVPFPHDNSEDVDLLGVFWADSDSKGITCDCTADCSICGTGVIYYQIYNFENQTVTFNEVAQEVLNRTTSDGVKYVPGFVSSSWVLVATWSQIFPYVYSYNNFSLEVSKYHL